MRSIPTGQGPAASEVNRYWGKKAASADQFRVSLQRHLDALIEEEESYRSSFASLGGDNGTVAETVVSHQYAASLLRELKAWIAVES